MATTNNDLNIDIQYYSESVKLTDILPINVGITSASQNTMISAFGSPLLPLTKKDQPERICPIVKQFLQTLQISEHLTVTGLKPAVESLSDVLLKVYRLEKANNHDLQSVLSTAGMLNVRLRNPTSGKPSKEISNHAWGTAIDFKLVAGKPPGDTNHSVPRFIAVLVPHLNAAGWYSGISFHDTMHFEICNEVINEWVKNDVLKIK